MMSQNFLSNTEVAAMNEDTAAWEKFLYVLEWVLALQMRYANTLRYSLVCVSFHDQRVLGDAYGARDAVQMLVELAGRLRQGLRKTDLVARNGTDIWVLIPFVTPESVLSKVSQIVDIAAANGLDIVDRDISIYSVPDAGILEGNRFSTPVDFLEFIGAQKNIAMKWPGTAGNPT
jgi:GGDEF domain-containing protein